MRWLIIIIVAIVALLFYFGQNSTHQAPPPPAADTPATAEASATPAPAPPSQPAQPPTLDPNLIARLKAAAQATGCQLTGVAPGPGGAWVAISWVSDNSAVGGDFLDECRKQGIIRDFDEKTAKYGGAVQNGRNVHTAQFNVWF